MKQNNTLSPSRRKTDGPTQKKYRKQLGYVGSYLGLDLRHWLEERAAQERRTKSDLLRLIITKFRDEGGAL